MAGFGGVSRRIVGVGSVPARSFRARAFLRRGEARVTRAESFHGQDG